MIIVPMRTSSTGFNSTMLYASNVISSIYRWRPQKSNTVEMGTFEVDSSTVGEMKRRL